MSLPPVPEPPAGERRRRAPGRKGLARELVEREKLRETVSLTSVGLTLGLSVAIGVGLGILVDRYFRTNGILVIVFSVLGIIAGFRELIKAVVQAGKLQEQEDARRRAEREALREQVPEPGAGEASEE